MCNECAQGTGLLGFRKKKKDAAAQDIKPGAGTPSEQYVPDEVPAEELLKVGEEESSCGC